MQDNRQPTIFCTAEQTTAGSAGRSAVWKIDSFEFISTPQDANESFYK
jgi:hypothetical protein